MHIAQILILDVNANIRVAVAAQRGITLLISSRGGRRANGE